VCFGERRRPGGRTRRPPDRAPHHSTPEPAAYRGHALLSADPAGCYGRFERWSDPDGDASVEVVFSRDGAEHRLVAWARTTESLWILFRDATWASRRTRPTVSSTSRPRRRAGCDDRLQPAINMPCAYTEFATCPLPRPRTHCRSRWRPASRIPLREPSSGERRAGSPASRSAAALRRGSRAAGCPPGRPTGCRDAGVGPVAGPDDGSHQRAAAGAGQDLGERSTGTEQLTDAAQQVSTTSAQTRPSRPTGRGPGPGAQQVPISAHISIPGSGNPARHPRHRAPQTTVWTPPRRPAARRPKQSARDVSTNARSARR